MIAHAILLIATAVQTQTPLRCGWWDNPSPGNIAFIGVDGAWDMAIQGVMEAKGDSPAFPARRWVESGLGSYGYGCVCFKPTLDREARQIMQFRQARSQPLGLCRRLGIAAPGASSK